MELIKPIRMNGFVAPYIGSYLAASDEWTFDEALLKGHVQGLVNSAAKFMKPKENRPGTFYASGATKPVCQTFYRMMGTQPDPKDDPWLSMKFGFGDIAEALIMLNLQLAYSKLEPTPKHSVGEWNSHIETPIGGKVRRGFVDGLLNFNHTWHEKTHGIKLYKDNAKYLQKNENGDLTEDLILEFKSVHSYIFELAQTEGLNDLWGWLGQMSCYQRSMKIYRGLFVLQDRASGAIDEFLIPYDSQKAKLADYNATYVEDHIKQGTVPPPPAELLPQIDKYEKVLCIGSKWIAGQKKAVAERRVCGFCDYARTCAAQQGYRLHKWEKEITWHKKTTFTAKVLEFKALQGETPPIRTDNTQASKKKKKIQDEIQTTFEEVMGRDGKKK